MTNKKHIFSIIFIGSLLTGCATGPSPTGIGLYTDVKGPITATSLPATKTGKACAQTVLGIVNTGDALMNPLMILVKIIKLRWIHILSYDQ
ncbi:TRL domain-containing protein, partial [Salmonella enterica subsp. enterica serovar Typhi]|uniref:TRL domain-containing protein n=1 Tax=Salmonella enterica TaxID=28901 RepID=UPI002DE7EAAD|nr:TRL domain-containing protein [Salmonella enterica subsp. enterica serovar Typhi]MEC4788691.1 TRL domain-containing protein [Salmonella enterica subsp. enterica serovar Typhi]MEC4802455.1 TRL domain-containing protein [Salmonella enterica subsp. enterica serovar Typhi]MEC4811503.1 TRL domain-containing protein [Salmonella enterica subsp. enterica serovar Typhi]MEC4824088.1 TRL domain-containing protein [Salmonella enterica subsp. enterica serovar Typhi]